MPDLDVTELRRLLEAASPLPWGFNSYSTIASGPRSREYETAMDALPDDAPDEEYERLPEFVVCRVPVVGGDTGTAQGQADARLIEAATNALPGLLDEIERQRFVVPHATEAVEELAGITKDFFAAKNNEIAALRARIETLEVSLRDLYSEANHVISGGDDTHDRCTECGCAGYGMLLDTMSRARAALEKRGGAT